MTTTAAEAELGPVDYLVVEYPSGQMSGEGIPHLIGLVEQGIISIIDLVVVRKNGDSYQALHPADVVAVAPELAALEDSAIDLLNEEDLDQIAGIIAADSAAVVIVYENTWAGPLVAAMRRAGGQVVAAGRIGVEDLLNALAQDEDDELQSADGTPSNEERD